MTRSINEPIAPAVYDDPNYWWLDHGSRLISEVQPMLPGDVHPDPAAMKYLRLREVAARQHRAGKPTALYLSDPPQGMPADVAARIRAGRPLEADLVLWQVLARAGSQRQADTGFDD